MSQPALAGIHHVKFPVSDVAASRAWYEEVFGLTVQLEFRDEALRAVARRAMQRKTGARGLRTILENVLLDTMYELPSLRNVAKVCPSYSLLLATITGVTVLAVMFARSTAVAAP